MANRIVLTGGKGKKYPKRSMKKMSRNMRKMSKNMKKMRKSMKKMRKSMKRMSRKSRRSRRGGLAKVGSKGKGTWNCVVKGRRCTRKGGSRKSKGAGVLQRAALPFGYLALQKMMQRKKSRKNLKKMGRRALRAPLRTAKFLL